MTPSSVVTSAAVVMLSTAMFGWTNGNMNTPAPAMRIAFGIPPDEAAPWREVIWGWCVSVYCLGALFGCFFSPRLADRLGRKRFILLNTVIFIVGALVQGLAFVGGTAGIVLTMVGRLIVGCASGGTTVVVPAYMGEIAPDNIRGALGVAFQLVVTISMLLAQLAGMPHNLGTESGWPLVMALAGAPGLVQLVLLSSIVESPRWLVYVGRTHEAELASARLSGTAPRAHYAELSDAAAAAAAARGSAEVKSDGASGQPAEAQGGGLRALLADARVRPTLILATITLMTQQLSGINNAFNYSTIFLAENGVSPEAIDRVTVWMNVVNVLMTLAATQLVDRSGRRVLLLSSTFGMALCTIVITLGMRNIADEWGVTLASIGIVTFVASFGIGTGPIPWLLPAELFSQEHRASAQGISALANWATNGVVATAFLPLADVLGSFSFLPFGAILALFTGYAYVALPETKGAQLGAAEEGAHADDENGGVEFVDAHT